MEKKCSQMPEKRGQHCSCQLVEVSTLHKTPEASKTPASPLVTWGPFIWITN